jgi:hypothetical protein
MLSPPVVDRLTNQALDVPYASDLVPTPTPPFFFLIVDTALHPLIS